MDRLTERQRAMAEENLSLVPFVLKRLGVLRCDRHYDELFSVGCLALCTAALLYKQGKIAFSTYAVCIIRRAAFNAFNNARKDERRTVSFESFCAGLAVGEKDFENIDAELYTKALFCRAGLSPPTDGLAGVKLSKQTCRLLKAFLREEE